MAREGRPAARLRSVPVGRDGNQGAAGAPARPPRRALQPDPRARGWGLQRTAVRTELRFRSRPRRAFSVEQHHAARGLHARRSSEEVRCYLPPARVSADRGRHDAGVMLGDHRPDGVRPPGDERNVVVSARDQDRPRSGARQAGVSPCLPERPFRASAGDRRHLRRDRPAHRATARRAGSCAPRPGRHAGAGASARDRGGGDANRGVRGVAGGHPGDRGGGRPASHRPADQRGIVPDTSLVRASALAGRMDGLFHSRYHRAVLEPLLALPASRRTTVGDLGRAGVLAADVQAHSSRGPAIRPSVLRHRGAHAIRSGGQLSAGEAYAGLREPDRR